MRRHRQRVGEALTGEHAGRVWSPEIGAFLGCRRAPNTRKATRSTPFWQGGDGPGGVGDLWHASKHCVRNPGGPASGLTSDRQVDGAPTGHDRDGRVQGVGPLQSTEEAFEQGRPTGSAEKVEGRELAKGNVAE